MRISSILTVTFSGATTWPRSGACSILLSGAEQAKVAELDEKLARCGCLAVGMVEANLGKPLFEKLRAAGMYDVNHVANLSGEYGFVTRPAAFHKFNDPLVDDAFDLAKALVAALSYGMTQSAASRGRIEMIGALLRKLINGYSVGPATAIGEDYRVLETKGVIRVTPACFLRLHDAPAQARRRRDGA